MNQQAEDRDEKYLDRADKRKRSENILRDIWNNIKQNNIFILQDPERGERERKISEKNILRNDGWTLS